MPAKTWRQRQHEANKAAARSWGRRFQHEPRQDRDRSIPGKRRRVLRKARQRAERSAS